MALVQRAMRGVLMVLLVVLVGCDHATKVAAKLTLERGGPHVVVPGVVDLLYTENRNVAFSVFHELSSPFKRPLLIAMSCLAIAAIVVAWWKRRETAGLLEQCAYVLVVGGAIGNVVDRWQLGYVVDFIHVGRWPVFNVADAAICVGGALAGIAMRQAGAKRAAS